MKKLYFGLTMILVTCILLLSMTSCGAKTDEAMDVGGTQIDYSYYSDGADGAPLSDITLEENKSIAPEEPGSSNTTSVADNRKIIKTTELTVETKEFDTLIDSIYNKIDSLGGYIENADIEGNSINSYNTRHANLTVRIPSGKDSSFCDYISENSVVTRQNITTDDVTLSYVDTESRLSALHSEKEALEKLLKEAKLIEDIIALNDRLTTVIQEIESYESQLRTYDNLVDYTTITLYIHEVEYSSTVKADDTVWQRISSNLKRNFANVWSGLKDVFVFMVSAIPYLMPFVIIGLIVLFSIRAGIRRKSKKKLNTEEPTEESETQ